MIKVKVYQRWDSSERIWSAWQYREIWMPASPTPGLMLSFRDEVVTIESVTFDVPSGRYLAAVEPCRSHSPFSKFKKESESSGWIVTTNGSEAKS